MLVVCAQIATGVVASTITLRDRADVGSETVRLGEIAELGSDVGGLSDLALWPAPPPCRLVRVSRAALALRLRELQTTRTETFELAGAEQVAIESACQRLEPALLTEAGRGALSAWLRTRAEQFDLTPVPSNALELAPGRLALVARELPPNQPVSARMQIWVDVFVDGRHVRATPVAFNVHAYRDAWVALHDVHAEQALAGAPLQRRRIDIAQERLEPLAEIPALARMRKPLLSGQPLTAAHVEEVPAIARGSSVIVRSRLGAIGIEARAEALQDGRPGQLVWVRVASATGPVRARVVADGTVEVTND